MLKRKIYRQFAAWKEKSRGRTALLVCGARRTGKSFIVQEFAKNEYASHIIIDFGNAAKEVKDIFLQDGSNLNLFFAKLGAYYRTKLWPRQSAIIFDEVQQFPPARQLLKYLVADGRYDYLETGSLVGLRQNVENIIIPSEEEQINLYPLDFEEFLWALGDDVTGDVMREHYDIRAELGQPLHRRIMNDFRQYMLVGGMPCFFMSFCPSCIRQKGQAYDKFTVREKKQGHHKQRQLSGCQRQLCVHTHGAPAKREVET